MLEVVEHIVVQNYVHDLELSRLAPDACDGQMPRPARARLHNHKARVSTGTSPQATISVTTFIHPPTDFKSHPAVSV